MIEHFNKFSEEELIKFEKFVCSPYFNTQKNLIKLYEYLISKYPRITKEDISKKNLSLIIYPGKKFSDVKIRKLISDFTILVEKFLTQLEIENTPVANRILLLSSLRKRGMRRRFEMNFRDVFNQQKKEFSKDNIYYRNQVNLQTEYYYFNFGNIRTDFANCLQEKSDNLDYYFIFNKLHNFHEMIHNEGIKNKNNFYDKRFLKEIVTAIEANREVIYKKHPNIFIIYNVLMMFDTLDDKYLYELLDYLKLNGKKFTKNSLSYYYQYASQYYIQKVNSGQINYRHDIFKIYEIMMDKNLFVIDNIITDLEFNSVVNISLAVKKYEWLANFIEKYKGYIDPDFAKDAYNLARSKLYFHTKEYEKIFQHLNEIELKDSTYYMNSKFLLAKVYFEMKNFVGLRYIVENLRQYIRIKETLGIEQNTLIRVFIKYITELTKLYESSSAERRSLKVIMKKELDNEKNLVPTLDWFYEKIAEI